MANVLVDEVSLQNIGNSIRNKKGISTLYKPAEMASAIDSIPTGGSVERTKWWRPPDMPQYENLPLVNQFIYCYCTFDKSYTTNTEFTIQSFYSPSGTVEIGIYNSSAKSFDVLSTYNFNYMDTKTITLPETDNQFLIFRFSAPGVAVVQGFKFDDVIPFVELYGYCGGYYDAMGALKQIGFIKYFTLFGTAYTDRKYYPQNLIRLDLSNTTGVTVQPTYNNFIKIPEHMVFSDNYKIAIPSDTGIYNGLANNFNGSDCIELDLSVLDTVNNHSLWNALYNNRYLTSLNISDFNCSNVENCTNFLSQMPMLKNIVTNSNTVLPSLSFNISASTLLTVQSILNIFNALPTITTTQTLTIGATNIAKLTSEQLQIATDKGWIVS